MTRKRGRFKKGIGKRKKTQRGRGKRISEGKGIGFCERGGGGQEKES